MTDEALPVSRARAISTEQGAWRVIAVATLPKTMPAGREVPCEPTLTGSAWKLEAADSSEVDVAPSHQNRLQFGEHAFAGPQC